MAGSRFRSFKSEKGDSAAQRRDPYEVLGVARNATDQEIKSVFRRMALKYHPDKNGDDPVASDMFQEVTIYYNILSDPDKRRITRVDVHILKELPPRLKGRVKLDFFDPCCISVGLISHITIIRIQTIREDQIVLFRKGASG